MRLFLTTLVVGLGSAVFPLVNIEAYLGAVGVAGHDVGDVGVAAAAAVGQISGKVILYYAADWAMRLPWMKKKMATPKWQESYEKWRERIADHPGKTTALLLASSALGLPPLLVIAVLAGHLRVNIWLFVSTCGVGRFLRFLVLLGSADAMVHAFHQVT